MTTIKDLGVFYDSSFSFVDHIQHVTAKALRMLGFIRRATIDFRDPLSLVSLYKSLVLPHLTYASVIWTPNVNEYFKPIESVQHRLLRLLSAKVGRPMNLTDHEYSPLMNMFGLPSLFSLHSYYDLIMAFKIRNGYFSSPHINDLFTLRVPSYEIRTFNSLAEGTHSKGYVFNASVPRLRRQWNALPRNLQLLGSIRVFNGLLRKRVWSYS